MGNGHWQYDYLDTITSDDFAVSGFDLNAVLHMIFSSALK